MATITTKYSVGDKVYIIDSRGITNEFVRIILEEVRRITIENYSVIYEFRTLSRRERDVYTDLDDAKKAAKNEAKQRYEKNIEIIDETRLGEAVVGEE